MAVKVLSIYIVGLAIVGTILTASDLRAFLDVPSALFVGSSFGLLFRVNWKIAFPMSEKVEGSDIKGWDLLGYTAIFMGVIGSLIALIIMLGIWAFFLINSTNHKHRKPRLKNIMKRLKGMLKSSKEKTLEKIDNVDLDCDLAKLI